MRWNAAVALVVGLAAAGCVRPGTKAVSEVGPAFELADLSGGRVKKSDLEGKVVVLDFWATWCGPCIKEIPEYREFARKNQTRGVEVVGVVFDSGEPAEIADFVRQHEISYRQLLGTDDVLDSYGGNLGFPTTFVLDAQGRIVSKTIGSPPGKFAALQAAVDQALAARAAS